MEPSGIRFGGGAAETLLNPLVAVWMLIAIALIFILPRHKVITPFLLAFFTIPLGQVILVGSLHFPVLRILILAGLVRMAISRVPSPDKKIPGGFNTLDLAVVFWAISGLVIVSLQWMQSQALVKFVGDFLDTMGGYLVVRFLIPDREGIRRMIKAMAAVTVILGMAMINEQISKVNVFGLLGGIPSMVNIRDGHVRANGVMGSLFAGAFAGVLIPLFLWLWTQPKSRFAAFAGIAGSTAMVVATFSSTSYLAYVAGLVGLAFWPLRKRMRLIRWGLVSLLTGLHLVMHGPVWSLIAKIDVTGGSSSYHRYALVDTLITHFNEWWLLGTRNNGAWGWEMWDTCDQFVAVAVTGGLLTLILYILILKRGFGLVGNARKQADGDRAQEWFLWCLGSSLFANVVAHFGINYMIQLQLVLFPLLACICVASAEIRQATAEKAGALNGGDLALARGPADPYLPLGERVRT
jgi:hypothetical protein